MNPMQERMIDFALDMPHCAWFACPGMGKTRAALDVIAQTSGRTLVIAPKLVCLSVWPTENRKWGYDHSMRFLHGRDRHLRGRERVSLVNYDALPWLVEQMELERESPYDLVIYDELSKLKNPEAKRFAAWEHVLGRFEYRLGMTGTPVGAHLKDLFGEMYVVDHGRSLGSDYRRFLRQYFHENEYTYQLEPYSDTEATLLDLIRPRAISFDIDDLDMPPLIHNPVSLELPGEVVRYYEELHEHSLVEDLDVYAMNAAVRSGKKRQMASGTVIDMQGERKLLHDAKAERLAEIVAELQGRPVMVFFEFLHDYEAICKVLGPTPALYGGTSTRDAVQHVEDWNAGRLPALALHPRSAAYGVNLQDSGSVIVWFTIPWSYEMVHQGTCRLWRQGQRNKVIVHYLIVAGTEDERVFDRVQERAGTHDRVMEGLL